MNFRVNEGLDSLNLDIVASYPYAYGTYDSQEMWLVLFMNSTQDDITHVEVYEVCADMTP